MKNRTFKLGMMGTFPIIEIDFNNQIYKVTEAGLKQHMTSFKDVTNISSETNLKGCIIKFYNNGNLTHSFEKIYPSKEYEKCLLVFNKIISREKIGPELLKEEKSWAFTILMIVGAISLLIIFLGRSS